MGFFITTHWETRKYLSILGVHSQLGNDEYPRNRAQCQACHTLYPIICRLIPVRLYLSTLPSISLIVEWEIPNDLCGVSYTCCKPQDIFILCSVGGVKMDNCRDTFARIILSQIKESLPWFLAIVDKGCSCSHYFAWNQMNVNAVQYSTTLSITLILIYIWCEVYLVENVNKYPVMIFIYLTIQQYTSAPSLYSFVFIRHQSEWKAVFENCHISPHSNEL